jgi:hypothetical protein
MPGIGYKNTGFKYPDTEEWQKKIKDLKVLAARDGVSVSQIYRLAIDEYHHRHVPGNPALPLDHWTEGVPFSPAAKEKLELELWANATLVKCACGGRKNCRQCGGRGEYTEEKA